MDDRPIEESDREPSKRCSRCGTYKVRSEFSRSERRRDGLDPWCRDCRRAYYLSQKPPDHQLRPYPRQRNVLSPDITEKRCTGCGVIKPIDAFPRNSHLPDGHMKRCRACAGSGRQERRFDRGSLEVRLAWERAYYARNRERILAHTKAYNDDLREDVLAAYGHRCACCGETTAEFLAVDHVNGRGGMERKELKLTGRAFYLWLKRQGFPSDSYRLLCHNCNSARGLYGYCPHERNVP